MLLRAALILYLKLKTLWKPYGYFGNYSTWEEAVKNSGTYDSESILQKVLEASEQVRDKKAVYERDGIAFQDAFEWEALDYFRQLIKPGEKLRVLDFGGALGSHYYPVAAHFSANSFDWTIIEQDAFVALGHAGFVTEELHFSADLSETLSSGKFDLALFGCVLPYLREPYTILDQILKAKPRYILIDKHPIIHKEKDRLTIQRIPPDIYPASYPAWFFAEKKFMEFMKDYELVDSYDCQDVYNINSVFKTYFYRLKQGT
ncbi:MAG TPA: methyltransferase, TIGR04325 family [Bacteroidetes bacterium]|nr:methyltransferase, TIGR04325 family [Bacteroidota bacterium]